MLGVTESDLGEDEDGSNRATVNRDVGAETPANQRRAVKVFTLHRLEARFFHVLLKLVLPLLKRHNLAIRDLVLRKSG